MNQVTSTSKVGPDIETAGGPTEDPEIRRAAADFASESSGTTVGAIEPGSVHLLTADSALGEHCRDGLYMGLCGAVLPVDDLPRWWCPDGCGCEHDRLICTDCVRRAAEQSELADQSGAVR